ncbi:MAG TPA: DinB family protein [Gemmatimonadaceae bacterium]|nr:DinB family protein [Gemmatimonadaceae bacterium]
MIVRSLLILSVSALPALAQAKAAPAADLASPVASARTIWKQTADYLVAAASDMPEGTYSFRPTPDVRTFGEVIGHVAGSQNMFCALALGEPAPAEDAVEKAATTKAALIAALRKSNDNCDRAYQQTDKASTAEIDLFGNKRSRFYALMQNAAHDGEHYGNIVTYLRMNKMVPPSSKPRPNGN